MAEYLARSLAVDDRVTFESAGTHAYPDVAPSDTTEAAMLEVGIDVSGHRSRPVTDAIDDADVVFTLSAEHRQALVSRWPDREEDIHMLRGDGLSITDPYGLDLETHRRTRDAIRAAIEERAADGWRG